MIEKYKNRREAGDKLLFRLKDHLSVLKELKESLDGHWGVEDTYYRFFHHSFKVYHAQGYIEKFQKIITEIAEKNEHYRLNESFVKILNEGLVGNFDLEHNKEWEKYTRPQIEALLHVSKMTDLMVKYAEELDENPTILPSGYAAVLYLFGVR